MIDLIESPTDWTLKFSYGRVTRCYYDIAVFGMLIHDFEGKPNDTIQCQIENDFTLYKNVDTVICRIGEPDSLSRSLSRVSQTVGPIVAEKDGASRVVFVAGA